MTPRYPGAYWVPTGDNGAMGRTPNASTFHIAVTRAERSVAGWNASAKACHAYNGKWGYFEQYMDWDRIAYGVKDGNGHVCTVESYDGLLIHNDPYWEEGIGGVYGTNADDGRWDDGQCERFADLAAWKHVVLGMALQVMTNSRSDNGGGFGPHRLGVDPWRTENGGGESWTAHDGKRCPGNERVKQFPAIIARAKVIAAAVRAGTADWLPPGEVDLTTALLRGTGGPLVPTSPKPTNPASPTVPEDDMELTPKNIEDIASAVARKVFGYNIRGASFEAHVKAQTTRSAKVINALLGRGGNRQVLQQIRKLVSK